MTDRSAAAALPEEDVQDYPRPPALEQVPYRLRVILAGAVLAETTSGYRVLETHHPPTYYFPPEDVRMGGLTQTQGSSWCEWKGAAQYFDATAGGMVSHRAAWAYPKPTKRFQPIAGYLSFYPERMEACFVGEELVVNQPGYFYGGWVTSNLSGIIKGGPGTEGW